METHNLQHRTGLARAIKRDMGVLDVQQAGYGHQSPVPLREVRITGDSRLKGVSST